MMENIELVDDNGDTLVMKPRRGPSDCLAMPSIRLSSRCFFKIHALAQVVNYLYPGKEAYMFVLGERMGEGTDIIIPKQEVSGVSVHITSDQVKSVSADIIAMNQKRDATNEEIRKFNAITKAKNDKIEKQNEARIGKGEESLPLLPLKKELSPLKITGWAHSHNTMSAFSSSVDEEMHKELHTILRLTSLAADAEVDEGECLLLKKFYIFGITVNVYKDECPIVYVSFPCGIDKRLPDRQNRQEIDVQEFEDSPMDEAEKNSVIDEIADVVEERVKMESHSRSGSSSSWYPWKDSRSREPEPMHRSTITQSLDNYYSKKKEPLSVPSIPIVPSNRHLSKDDGEAIDTALNWKIFKDIIAKDGIIINEMTKIKNLLKNKENFAVMKETIIQIIIREHELFLHEVHDVVDSVDKHGNETKEKIKNGDVEKTSKIIASIETERDGSSEDEKSDECQDKYRDESGDPIKCASCKKDILDDNYSGYDDDDGNPLCDDCYAGEDGKEDEDDGGEVKDEAVLGKETDVSKSDEMKPWNCAKCHVALVVNNFFGDKDKDGKSICTRCKADDKIATNIDNPPSRECESGTTKTVESKNDDVEKAKEHAPPSVESVDKNDTIINCYRRDCGKPLVRGKNFSGKTNGDGESICDECWAFLRSTSDGDVTGGKSTGSNPDENKLAAPVGSDDKSQPDETSFYI